MMQKLSINLGVAGASEGVSLPPCAQVSLLVVLVGPNLEDIGGRESVKVGIFK